MSIKRKAAEILSNTTFKKIKQLSGTGVPSAAAIATKFIDNNTYGCTTQSAVVTSAIGTRRLTAPSPSWLKRSRHRTSLSSTDLRV